MALNNCKSGCFNSFIHYNILRVEAYKPHNFFETILFVNIFYKIFKQIISLEYGYVL